MGPRIKGPGCKLTFCKVKKDKFSHYAEYLLGIDDAEALLEKVLSSNDRVAAVVDAGVEKATEHKFKLIELIKLPMQRILRTVSIKSNRVRVCASKRFHVRVCRTLQPAVNRLLEPMKDILLLSNVL